MIAKTAVYWKVLESYHELAAGRMSLTVWQERDVASYEWWRHCDKCRDKVKQGKYLETCPPAEDGQLSATESTNKLVQGFEPLPLDAFDLLQMRELKVSKL